jgi:predicted negative regulator of RcsB-dependent stress response
MDKKQQTRIAIYVLLAIVIGVVGYYYYNYLQKQAQDIETATLSVVSKKLSGRKLDSEVLKDKKFKELQRIKIEEAYIDKTGTSTVEVLEEVARIPRRHSDPFKPF